MKSNKLLIYIIIILILSNLFFIFKYNISNRNIDSVEIVKVDTFIKKDTFTKWYPKPVEVKVRDTIYIPIDSIKTEGDSIILPREEKTYEDSTYRAVVSGFHPKLEEITIFPKTYTIEKTKTVTVTKKDHWNYGIGVGVGYGLVHRKPDIYAGFTVGYTF